MYGTLATTVSEMKDERRLLFLKHMHLKKDRKNHAGLTSCLFSSMAFFEAALHQSYHLDLF